MKSSREKKKYNNQSNLFKFIFWNGNLWCIEIDDVLIFKPFATLRALKYKEEETSNHGE